MYKCIHVYMYICTYVHMYICICIYVSMYLCIYVSMYTCIYVVYILICVYMTYPPTPADARGSASGNNIFNTNMRGQCDLCHSMCHSLGRNIFGLVSLCKSHDRQLLSQKETTSHLAVR